MNFLNHLSLSAAVVLCLSVVLLLLWAFVRSRRLRTGITASHSGVVVNGNNHGLINTGSIHGLQQPTVASLIERALGIAGSIASIVGLYLVFFPPGVAGK